MGKIYIVRHGQTDANAAGIVHSRTDTCGLNDVGRKQADEVKKQLENIRFDEVFCSPKRRALETCRIICDKECTIDVRLDERDFGELEHKIFWPIPDFDIEIVHDMNREYSYEGVEPLAHAKERIHEFINEIKEKHRGKNVLVVSHAGSAGLNSKIYVLGPSPDGKYWKPPYLFDNCEVLEIDNCG